MNGAARQTEAAKKNFRLTQIRVFKERALPPKGGAPNGKADVNAAARLVLKTAGRENAGEVWLRVRRVAERAPINSSFVRGADRLRRIDEYRRRTHTRHGEDGRITEISIEGASPDAASDASWLAKYLQAHTGLPLDLPVDFINELMNPLNARERAIAWSCLVDGVTQREMAEVLGLTPQRICQIVHAIVKRLRRHIETKYPRLREELKAA